jgi:RimJ/RimL family protein N-acetyltransferase
MAVLPAYQGRQLPRVVLPLLFERLKRAAVRRVEAETSPSNLVTIHVLTRMRFNITGNALSDRWGALLRMTKYLDRDAEDVFLDTFCVGIPYQLRRAESDNNKP